MRDDLTGRLAVVTGASSGLGERFARLLAEQGARVAVLARRTDRLEALCEDIAAHGGEARAFGLDVAKVHDIGPTLDRIESAMGPISIMINNAGVGGEGMALDITPEDFDHAFHVNTRGVFFGAREAARCMIASGVGAREEGRIINIASIASFNQLPGLVTYCATKAAVASMTRGLAREWARKGISVNAICPGYIETEINADWFRSEGGQKQMAKFPRKRLMDEDGLDEALLMLSGRLARNITGSLITLDDGQML